MTAALRPPRRVDRPKGDPFDKRYGQVARDAAAYRWQASRVNDEKGPSGRSEVPVLVTPSHVVTGGRAGR